jgi:hypothetical protein
MRLAGSILGQIAHYMMEAQHEYPCEVASSTSLGNQSETRRGDLPYRVPLSCHPLPLFFLTPLGSSRYSAYAKDASYKPSSYKCTRVQTVRKRKTSALRSVSQAEEL